MKKPRNRYHHGSLRASALQAAAREIDAHGHEGFSLERIAKSLGVTPAALYRHYKNRDALLTATVWDGFVAFVARLDGAVAAQTEPREVLRAAGRAFVRFAIENPGWFRLQFSRAGAALPVPHEQANPQYPIALGRALSTWFGDDQATIGRWFLFTWAFMHGVAAHAVEHVLPNLTTDEQRLAQADVLIDTLLEALDRAGPGRTGPGHKVKRRKSRD